MGGVGVKTLFLSLLNPEPSCPENSHWETCVDICRASCSKEDVSLSLACHSRCREGCVCDTGYLLSGSACVSLVLCGCPWQGHILHLGVQELNPNCRELCECREAGRPPHCSPQVSGDREACLLCTGAWHCGVRRGTSWVSGDPHDCTFNSAAFTAQGACRYVLSHTCRANLGALPFTV